MTKKPERRWAVVCPNFISIQPDPEAARLAALRSNTLQSCPAHHNVAETILPYGSRKGEA